MRQRAAELLPKLERAVYDALWRVSQTQMRGTEIAVRLRKEEAELFELRVQLARCKLTLVAAGGQTHLPTDGGFRW